MAALALACMASCNRSTEYRIHGTVTDPGLNGAQIFLVPTNPDEAIKENIDSVVIVDQKFEFTGTVERVSDIRVEMYRRMNTQNLLVVTEPGDINVTIGEVSMGGGTRQNDSLQVWKDLTIAHYAKTSALSRNRDTAAIKEASEAYRARSLKMADNLGDCTLSTFLRERFPERK